MTRTSQLCCELLTFLRRLQHAARAARLEAQVVELEAAIAKAHAGDVRVLQAWLDHLNDLPATNRFPTSTAIGESSSESCARQVASHVVISRRWRRCLLHLHWKISCRLLGGWSSYLLNARQRLDAIQHQHGDALSMARANKNILCAVATTRANIAGRSFFVRSSSRLVRQRRCDPGDRLALPTVDLGCSTIDDEQSLEDAAEQRDERQCEQREEQLSEGESRQVWVTCARPRSPLQFSLSR